MPDEQPLPDVVYHYTSMDTLLKIVDKSCIWATNINYLNDVLERTHCLARVEARLNSAEGTELFGTFKSPYSNDFNSMGLLPFVASFSKERDSLTHWRSYCSPGNGVCIGFRTESLKNAFLIRENAPMKEVHDYWTEFGAVTYLGPNDSPSVDQMIQDAVRAANDYQSANPEYVKLGLGITAFWLAIDRFAAKSKHDSFAAEKEFRLVIGTKSNVSLDGICYRASRSTLVPYVRMSLPDPEKLLSGVWDPVLLSLVPNFVQPYFIDNVTIGPTPHPNLSEDSLVTLFQSAHRYVIVRCSDVPYRDW